MLASGNINMMLRYDNVAFDIMHLSSILTGYGGPREQQFTQFPKTASIRLHASSQICIKSVGYSYLH